MNSPISDNALNSARNIIRNQYGSALAEKASNALCLNLTSPLGNQPITEAMMPTPTTQPTRVVVEFSSEPSTLIADRNLLDSEAWYKLKGALKNMEISPQVASWQALQVLRQTSIMTYREKILKSANIITDHIERSLSRLYALRTQSLANEHNLTQTCWLNQVVQTLSDPIVLADVAADHRIKSIDLPRRLRADINETGAIIGNPIYRQHFKHSGKGIIVAVIDSEVALSHPALQGRVVHRRNYTLEPWGNPDFHGTAVAGIIGGEDATFSGIAPEVTIYNYKVLATSYAVNATDFEGTLALQHSLEDGVHIANCSWGVGRIGNGQSREARACNTAWALGLTIVKSAGNEGPDQGTMTSPADATGIIVVGATNKLGNDIANYSSRGSINSSAPRPHVVAPGGTPDIGMKSCLITGGFGACGHGTSYAAPHITGILALLLEADPDITPDELRTQIVNISNALPGIDLFAQGAGLPSMLRLIP